MGEKVVKCILFLILNLVITSTSLSSVLYEAEALNKSLFSDYKALKVGDLITIIIAESSSATHKASTDTEKGLKASGGPGTGFLDFLTSWGISSKDEFGGKGSTTRSGSLRAKITARIVDVLPNGNYKIEGTQVLVINNEKQTITLTGIVRAVDISANNTVLSNMVSDAKIEYEGKGPIDRKQKPGLLHRILDWLF